MGKNAKVKKVVTTDKTLTEHEQLQYNCLQNVSALRLKT